MNNTRHNTFIFWHKVQKDVWENIGFNVANKVANNVGENIRHNIWGKIRHTYGKDWLKYLKPSTLKVIQTQIKEQVYE